MNQLMIIVNLTQVLKERNKTLYWLAKESGVTYKTLWMLASAEKTPHGITFPVLARICKTLGCKPGDILDYADNIPAPVSVASKRRAKK